jgi:hypothetical protein
MRKMGFFFLLFLFYAGLPDKLAEVSDILELKALLGDRIFFSNPSTLFALPNHSCPARRRRAAFLKKREKQRKRRSKIKIIE